MSAANVEPEEVEAILAAVGEDPGPAKEVASRDFRQPRRLSSESLVRAQRALQAATPRAQLSLSTVCGESLPLSLASVREVSAEGLLDEVAQPMAVVEMEVDGQPGWVVWENVPATTCIDRILGGTPVEEPEPRPLSRVERRMLLQLAEALVGPLAAAIGVRPGGWSAPSQPAELRTWRDGANGGDNQRIALELTCEHPEEETSVFLVYLPGVSALASDPVEEPAEEAPEEPLPAPDLPEHLAPVGLDATVVLGRVELPLDDLLALEEGDVIPLSTKVGEPLDVTVEERAWCKAVLGRSRGSLAVRLHDERESPSPTEPTS